MTKKYMGRLVAPRALDQPLDEECRANTVALSKFEWVLALVGDTAYVYMDGLPFQICDPVNKRMRQAAGSGLSGPDSAVREVSRYLPRNVRFAVTDARHAFVHVWRKSEWVVEREVQE